MPKKKTTQEWWAEVKADPDKLIDWLKDQYHGEVTAATRIRQFAEQYVPTDSRWRRVVMTIAGQEEQHAVWVGELLTARGLAPTVLEKTERYWDQTLGHIDSAESAAAVAAHAEQMRLERIRLIMADTEIDADIREVFGRILKEEEFHALAFGEMAGGDAMAAALEAHERGLDAINLIPQGKF